MALNLSQARVALVTRREVLDDAALPSQHAWGADYLFELGATRVATKRIRWLDALGERLRLGPNVTEQCWLLVNRRKYDFVLSKDTDLICLLCGMLWLLRLRTDVFAWLHFPLRSSMKDFFVAKRGTLLFALSPEIHRLTLVTYPETSQAVVSLAWAVDTEFYDRIAADLTKAELTRSLLAPPGKLRILLIGITGRKFAAFLRACDDLANVEVRVLTDSAEVLRDLEGRPQFSSVRSVPGEPVSYQQLTEEYLACDMVAIPLRTRRASDAELIRERATLWGITTLLEASAVSKPVVMSYNPVLEFNVANQQCGLLVEEDTPERWREAIAWCQANQAELPSMGGRARRYVEENYPVSKMQYGLRRNIESYYNRAPVT